MTHIVAYKKQQQFTQCVRASRTQLVRLVRGKYNGKSLWHYVLIDSLKFPLYQRALNGSSININEYGKILFSGWGKNPPAHITTIIEQQYA